MFAADIQNTYLTAPCGEKIVITCGPEYGSEYTGKIALLPDHYRVYGATGPSSVITCHLT